MPGMMTFSSAVKSFSRKWNWKMKPTSRFRYALSSDSASSVMSVPCTTTCPAVGRSRPPMRPSSVLLPHPLSPVMATVAPARHGEVHVAEHLERLRARDETPRQARGSRRAGTRVHAEPGSASLIAEHLAGRNRETAREAAQRGDRAGRDGEKGDQERLAEKHVGRHLGQVEVVGEKIAKPRAPPSAAEREQAGCGRCRRTPLTSDSTRREDLVHVHRRGPAPRAAQGRAPPRR